MEQLRAEERIYFNIQSEAQAKRLVFIDHLRWLMIIFVVMIHGAVTYSSIGGWYYYEKRELDLLSFSIFAVFQTFTQAYFMGFLFLLAGYFVPAAYDRKGFIRFIKDRMIRLGVPTLVYMLIIHPFIRCFLIEPKRHNGNILAIARSYAHYIGSLSFLGASGPLWFAFALLGFSSIYALIRRRIQDCNSRKEIGFSKHKQVIGIILLIACLAFSIRLIQPIGTSIMNMQFCFFAQYIVLFIIGTIAYRKDWFLKLPYRFGLAWFKAGFYLGVPLWISMMILGGGLTGKEYMFMGGLYWQAALYAFWESFFCICMCLGLIVIFREKYNQHTKWSKWLADHAFGVYVFHAPILIGCSLVFKKWEGHHLLKFLIVTMLALIISFLFCSIIRKIGWIKKIFS